MSTAELPCYTLINVPSDFETPNEMQLKQDLEKGNTKEKIEALKKTIYMILNGEKIQGLLMNIIRFFKKSSDQQPKPTIIMHCHHLHLHISGLCCLAKTTLLRRCC